MAEDWEGLLGQDAVGIIGTSTSAILRVTQKGTGRITEFKDETGVLSYVDNDGYMTLPGSPTSANQAATKAYVDAGGGAAHNLLSANHPDTTAGTVVAGDLVTGNATPKWVRLARGTAGYVLKAGASVLAWGQVAFSELTGALGTGQHGSLADGDHTGTIKPNLLQVVTTAQTGTANRFRMLQAMVRATKSADQVLTLDAWGAITFDGETFDTDNLHDNATNPARLTASIAGKYLVMGGCRVWTGAIPTVTALIIEKQGATEYARTGFGTYSANDYIATLDAIVDLAATEYVQLKAYFSGGISATVKPIGTLFSMLYVGE